MVSKLSYVVLAAALVCAAALAVTASAAAPGEPLSAARFSITIDGVEIAAFSELGGITSEVQPAQNAIGGKLPGKRTPPTVTLKRGLNSSLDLWAWHQGIVDGQLATRNATLTMYGVDGRPVARYYLESAWPSKLEIGALKAGASEVLYETVTFTGQNIQRLAP